MRLALIHQYTEVWDLYDQNLITQTELRHRRFRMVFDNLGVTDHSLCDVLNDEYLIISPLKPHLIDDGCHKVLSELLRRCVHSPRGCGQGQKKWLFCSLSGNQFSK